MLKLNAVLVSALLLSSYGGPWTITKDKDLIKTYIGVGDENGLKPTRSEMIVNASPSKVLKVIQDIPNYTEWIPYCEETKVLDRLNDSTFHYYQFMDMPLVKNRDLIVKVRTSSITDGYRINMTVAPEHIPLDEDAVRIAVFSAQYEITQMEGGKTKISMENKVDPGGFIPTFALNWASRSQPFETFSNLKEQILKN